MADPPLLFNNSLCFPSVGLPLLLFVLSFTVSSSVIPTPLAEGRIGGVSGVVGGWGGGGGLRKSGISTCRLTRLLHCEQGHQRRRGAGNSCRGYCWTDQGSGARETPGSTCGCTRLWCYQVLLCREGRCCGREGRSCGRGGSTVVVVVDERAVLWPGEQCCGRDGSTMAETAVLWPRGQCYGRDGSAVAERVVLGPRG